MTRYRRRAALYPSLMVAPYEGRSGEAMFEYDLPAALSGQCDDERVTEVDRDLDPELGRALRAANSV